MRNWLRRREQGRRPAVKRGGGASAPLGVAVANGSTRRAGSVRDGSLARPAARAGCGVAGAIWRSHGASWRTRQSARQRGAPARPRGERARSSRHSRRSGPVGRCGLEQMLQAAQAFQIAEKTLVCPLRAPGTGVVASNRHPAATAVALQRTTQDRQLDSRGPSAAWLRPARPRLDRSAGSRPVTPLARTGAVITVRPHDCRRGGLGAAFGPVALTTAASP